MLIRMNTQSQHTVLVLTRDQRAFASRLHALNLPGLTILAPETEDGIESGLEVADILLATPPLIKDHIHKAGKLVWMQSSFAGIDAMMGPNMRRDYVLTNVKETYGPVMAEFVLAYLFLFEKDILQLHDAQKKHFWAQRPTGTLRGKTVCVLGTGSIGREIARALKFFGVRVLGYRTKREPVEFFDEIFDENMVPDFLGGGDYVVNVLPSTSQTMHFFNATTFAMMKPTAIFLNVGRGNAVDEQALVEALDASRLRGAVLDVFETEPLPQESPLWSHEKILVTPHLSGYILTDRIFEIFAENYRRFVNGDPLLYQVDFQKGY